MYKYFFVVFVLATSCTKPAMSLSEISTSETEINEPFPEGLWFECHEGSNAGYPIIGTWNIDACELLLCYNEDDCRTMDCGQTDTPSFEYSLNEEGRFVFHSSNEDYEYCIGSMLIHVEGFETFTAESQTVEGGAMNIISATFSAAATEAILVNRDIMFAFGGD